MVARILPVKIYQEPNRRKNTTLADELILVNQEPENRSVATGKSAFSKLKERKKYFFSTDKRQQQLSALSEGREKSEITIEEQEVNQLLTISIGSFILAIGGMWIPALNILFIPAIIYLIVPWFKTIYKLSIKENRWSLAIVELFWSTAALATGHYIAFSFLLSFIFFSEKLMMKTEDRSMGQLVNIFSEQPRSVWVAMNDVEIEVPFESVKVGDTVVIQAGQTIAVDGMIIDGYAMIDQRTLTGESQPVEKSIAEQVFASTVVLSGKIKVEIEKAGSDTVAAQIGDILMSTASYQSGMRAIGLRIAEKGAIPTLAFGALALITVGIESALAMFNTGFGYPLRAGAPIAMLNFLRIASEQGILIKDGRSLELLGKVDTVVFDKTGTLTEEVPTVGQIYVHQGSEDELLRYTAAAEYKQTHPIARAILKEASQRKLNLPDIGLASYEVGYGLKVWVEERLVQVGSIRFLEMSDITIPEGLQQIQEDANSDGHSLVYIAIDEQFAGAIELCPTIRPEARELVHQLKQKKMSTVIISGDNEKPTKKLATTLGIERYFAETLPEDKANLIEQLQGEGKSICFIGDGINDSIAMKKAQVSVSLSGASSVAIDTAGIILMDGTLSQVMPLFGIGHDFKRTLERGIIMSILPGIACVGGVFFLHWGIVNTILLYQFNLSSNMVNSLWPLLSYQRKKLKLGDNNRKQEMKAVEQHKIIQTQP